MTGVIPIESESEWKFLDVRFELLTQAPVAAWAAANPCHVFCCPLPLCLLAQAGLRIAFTGNMILVCANITLTWGTPQCTSDQSTAQLTSEDANCVLRRGFGNGLSEDMKIYDPCFLDLLYKSVITWTLKWSTLGGNLICTNRVISKTVSNMMGAYRWFAQTALTTDGGNQNLIFQQTLNKP